MAMLPAYAELHCRSNFSFLTGASSPEELVDRAATLRYTALANGEHRVLWSTFTPQQVDIDVEHPTGRRYLESILERL